MRAFVLVASQGLISYPNTIPLTPPWQHYSGPTNAIFSNANLTNTTATFDADAVAYDAVVITVAPLITLGISRLHSNRHLSWTGGTPPFVIEQTTNFPPAFWISILTTAIQGASFPIAPGQTYFRVRGN